jgi:hypothetical protein
VTFDILTEVTKKSGFCLGVAPCSGSQPGVRLTPRIREDILRGT